MSVWWLVPLGIGAGAAGALSLLARRLRHEAEAVIGTADRLRRAAGAAHTPGPGSAAHEAK